MFFKPLNITYSNKHLPVLDGLRGFAVFIVILYHLFPYLKGFSFGWMGVNLFFVLSGFLITGILLNTKDSPNYYTNYLARRILRIFPLYYLFLILFFVGFSLTVIPSLIPDYAYLHNHQLWYWLYIQNWLPLFDTDYPSLNILSHFWSLAIEEQFYIFWPFIVYITPRKNMLFVCVSLILFSITCRLIFYTDEALFSRVYTFTLTRLDGLAIGSALAVMIRDPYYINLLNRYTLKLALVLAALLAITVAISKSLSFYNPLLGTYGYTLIDLFFGCILVTTLSHTPSNIVKSAAEMKWLTFLGKYSYGIYVYHVPLYRLLADSLNGITNSNLLTSLLCLLLLIGLAYLSYHLVEKPFLKLKSRFSHTPVPVSVPVKND